MEEVPSFNFERKFSVEWRKERTCISFIPKGSSAPLQKKERIPGLVLPASTEKGYVSGGGDCSHKDAIEFLWEFPFSPMPLYTHFLIYWKEKKIGISGFLEKKWAIITRGKSPGCCEFRRYVLLCSSSNKYCKTNQIFLGLHFSLVLGNLL